MQNLFLGISKYLFIILISFFVLFSFIILSDNKKKSHKAALVIQGMMMYLFHLLAYIVIFINTKNATVIIFYGAQVIFLVIFRGLHDVLYEKKYNKGLLNNMCMLLIISFVMLTRLSYSRAIKQFAIVFVSCIVALMIPVIIRKYKGLAKISYIYCFAGLAFLSVVLIIGQITHGAKLSIQIAGFSFQPSEFVKILFVLFIASLLNKSTKFAYVLISAIFAGAHVIILVLSKDLGSALIFFLVYIIMLYVATGNCLYFFGGIFSGTAAAVLAYNFFEHVQVRVQAYRDPWSVIETGGYQVAQSLFAIGTGGFLGLGLYQGLPTSIPLVEQDFMFSAIAEELGGFFAILLIFLCMSCFVYFIKVSIKQNVMFYKLTGLGLSITYAVQTILTVGGAIKFIPSTGVTLPLISYGGSSVLCTMIIFAIIQGLFLNAYDIQADEIERTKSNEESRKINSRTRK